ncbi:aldo/keto reductase [Hymenobacter seoulensis]
MSSIHTVALGRQGLVVPIQGLGCMGMTTLAGMTIYSPADEAESIATIHRARELGVNFLDTADLYGPLLNEQLVGKAIAGQRAHYLIATKFGYEIDAAGQLSPSLAINGQPAYIRQAVERSLRNLKTDYIDLYYMHRPDPGVPIEDSVGAMAELVQAGKVRYLGLSEVPVATIRRAHAVHPLTAIQTEYSLFDRGVEADGVLALTRELGIGFVGYSPLGRGFLTGAIKRLDDLDGGDFRRHMPRYQPENFARNRQLVDKLEHLARAKGVTPAQLALAWVLAQGVVAIPGTKRVSYLEANVAAASIGLSPQELAEIDATLPVGSTAGAAY